MHNLTITKNLVVDFIIKIINQTYNTTEIKAKYHGRYVFVNGTSGMMGEDSSGTVVDINTGGCALMYGERAQKSFTFLEKDFILTLACLYVRIPYGTPLFRKYATAHEKSRATSASDWVHRRIIELAVSENEFIVVNEILRTLQAYPNSAGLLNIGFYGSSWLECALNTNNVAIIKLMLLPVDLYKHKFIYGANGVVDTLLEHRNTNQKLIIFYLKNLQPKGRLSIGSMYQINFRFRDKKVFKNAAQCLSNSDKVTIKLNWGFLPKNESNAVKIKLSKHDQISDYNNLSLGEYIPHGNLIQESDYFLSVLEQTKIASYIHWNSKQKKFFLAAIPNNTELGISLPLLAIQNNNFYLAEKLLIRQADLLSEPQFTSIICECLKREHLFNNNKDMINLIKNLITNNIELADKCWWSIWSKMQLSEDCCSPGIDMRDLLLIMFSSDKKLKTLCAFIMRESRQKDIDVPRFESHIGEMLGYLEQYPKVFDNALELLEMHAAIWNSASELYIFISKLIISWYEVLLAKVCQANYPQQLQLDEIDEFSIMLKHLRWLHSHVAYNDNYITDGSTDIGTLLFSRKFMKHERTDDVDPIEWSVEKLPLILNCEDARPRNRKGVWFGLGCSSS